MRGVRCPWSCHGACIERIGSEIFTQCFSINRLFSQIEAELWIALAMGGYLSGRFEASVAAVVKKAAEPVVSAVSQSPCFRL